MSSPLPRLRYGDILLKDKGSPFNWFTKIKTWSEASHCELFVGAVPGRAFYQVATAFPKGGVDYYDYTPTGLLYVLRPQVPLSNSGIVWFDSEARGQAYDTIGFAAFFFARAQGVDNGAQFCSEVLARVFKKAGQALLHPRMDCDTYAPGSFLLSPGCDIIWAKDGAKYRVEGV